MLFVNYPNPFSSVKLLQFIFRQQCKRHKDEHEIAEANNSYVILATKCMVGKNRAMPTKTRVGNL